MSHWLVLENWSYAQHTCMKCLDEMKRSETWDETPRPFGPRPRQDRDVEHFVRDETETLVHLETVSRPIHRDWDHIPVRFRERVNNGGWRKGHLVLKLSTPNPLYSQVGQKSITGYILNDDKGQSWCLRFTIESSLNFAHFSSTLFRIEILHKASRIRKFQFIYITVCHL